MSAFWGDLLVNGLEHAATSEGLLRQPGSTQTALAAEDAPRRFEDWSEWIRPRLIGLARRFLGNTHDAEEIAQDALAIAWRHAARLPDPPPRNAWAFRTTVNLCLNRRRKSREQCGMPDNLAAQADAAPLERSELTERVRVAIASLPDRQQAAIVLREMEGMDYEAVGAILGIHPTTARVQVHRAREGVRDFLTRRWPETFKEQ